MATPAGDAVALSGVPAIDGLVQGGRWEFAGARQLTYSFSIETELGIGWTDALQAAVRRALAAWSAVADVSFQETASGSDVNASPADLALVPSGIFLQLLLGASAIGIFPDPDAADTLIGSFGNTRTDYPRPEGDIYFDNLTPPFEHLAPGGAGFAILVHEIGHALGLKHPSDDGLNGRPLVPEIDNPRLTVMKVDTASGNLSSGHAATPLLEDIRAIQTIYGANDSYRTGNDTYLIQADGARRAIWDAGGTDTLNASASPVGLVISLAEGSFIDVQASSTVAIAYGVTIENAIGSGFADRIDGNATANRLEGRAGADTLDGGAGSDTLIGGAGSDRYVFADAGDVLIEAAGGGADTIEARLPLGTVPEHFENLELLAAGALDVTGNALANRITGNGSENRLDGGAGADTLAGGAGNDFYVVDHSGDRAIEASDAGTDRVQSAASFALGANVEHLVLVGAADVNATGNAQDNDLTGNSGANVLDGGAGNDTLTGGRGDDTYVVDSAGDVLLELAAQGRDTIVTPFGTVLPAVYENLFLSGTGGVNATGNGANNLLRGNSGANVLDGGAGLDSLEGGAGNDTYVIDRLLEQGNISDTSGLDTLVSSARSTSLANGLENLTLTGSAFVGNGNASDNLLTGTDHLDVLFGGAGADTLDGGGGDDFLFGGDGNDVFVVGSAADFAIEFGGPGTGLDTVRSSALAFDLATNGLHVERLVLLDGAAAGTGNALANTLLGNSGDNTLAGGAGNDTLTGGAGADRFVFDTAPGAGNRDLIADFSISQGDRIVLDNDIFTALGAPGALAAAAFRAGAGVTAAADADDRIVLNTTNGALYYDADGAGGAAAVPIGTIQGLIDVGAASFEIV